MDGKIGRKPFLKLGATAIALLVALSSLAACSSSTPTSTTSPATLASQEPAENETLAPEHPEDDGSQTSNRDEGQAPGQTLDDSSTSVESTDKKEQVFLPDKISAVRESSRFPALVDPEFITADEAVLDDHELVLGLSLGGESKAYPLRMMHFHHVANDSIGGQPVAITY